MNQRNIQALEEVIQQGIDHVMRGHKVESPWTKGQLRILAEFIASRGVLVPSALSDEECAELGAWGAASVRTSASMGSHPCIRVLERIAKGETE